MSISSRIHDTIENWQDEWKDKLRGWALRTIAEGVKSFLEADEPAAIGNVNEIITRIKANPNTPPELRAMIDRIEGGGSWFMIVIVVIMAAQMLIQTVSTLWTPTQKQMSYVEERVAQTHRLDPFAVITAWRRDPEKYIGFFEDLKDLGWTDERIEALKFYTLFYPAPADLVRWQAREVFEPKMIERYGLDSEYAEINKAPFYKAGMTDEQILNYWRAHWEHASYQQMVEMLHREIVTEEEFKDWFRVVEIVPHWREGLLQSAYTWPTRVDVRRWWDMRTIDETELRRLYSGMGYRGVNLDNYILWTKVYVAFPDLMARWTNGWITEDDVRNELTGLGMPAARVEEMIQTKIKPGKAGRVSGERDVTKTDIIKGVKKEVITRDEGIELLIDLGYDEDEATYILDINIPRDEVEEVVKSRELTKTEILTGLKTAVISEEEALARLVEIRYTPDDAATILDIFKAAAEPPIEAWQREASKADIVAAVKKGLITPESAYLRLQDIGFSAEAANFILLVRAEVSPFSAISYNEFKDITTKYKIAIGKEEKPMPEELIKAGEEVVKLTGEVKALGLAIKEEERGLITGQILPKKASKKRDELKVALHRAEAELARVKTGYDAEVAEWKHGLP